MLSIFQAPLQGYVLDPSVKSRPSLTQPHPRSTFTPSQHGPHPSLSFPPLTSATLLPEPLHSQLSARVSLSAALNAWVTLHFLSITALSAQEMPHTPRNKTLKLLAFIGRKVGQYKPLCVQEGPQLEKRNVEVITPTQHFRMGPYLEVESLQMQ